MLHPFCQRALLDRSIRLALDNKGAAERQAIRLVCWERHGILLQDKGV
jgi:hypothetical protein